MGVQLTTVKRLFAKSSNQCAMPRCTSPIIKGDLAVGEICHIRARRKNGPRYDPNMTAEERDGFANLLLLCQPCHKLVDAKVETYTTELLTDIKEMHERGADCEITPQIAKGAEKLYETVNTRKVSARAKDQGIAIAVAGGIHAPVTIHQSNRSTKTKSKYPANAIGNDAYLSGYIEYLMGLGMDYWKGVPDMNPGRLGKKVKTHFRLKTRTRQFIPVSRFEELVDFIISNILIPSPAGKRHMRNRTRICRTLDEWKNSPF